MENNTGKALGVTFYCPDGETFRRVAKLRKALGAADIPTLWVARDYQGERIMALNVYGDANVVAGHLHNLDN